MKKINRLVALIFAASAGIASADYVIDGGIVISESPGQETARLKIECLADTESGDCGLGRFTSFSGSVESSLMKFSGTVSSLAGEEAIENWTPEWLSFSLSGSENHDYPAQVKHLQSCLDVRDRIDPATIQTINTKYADRYSEYDIENYSSYTCGSNSTYDIAETKNSGVSKVTHYTKQVTTKHTRECILTVTSTGSTTQPTQKLECEGISEPYIDLANYSGNSIWFAHTNDDTSIVHESRLFDYFGCEKGNFFAGTQAIVGVKETYVLIGHVQTPFTRTLTCKPPYTFTRSYVDRLHHEIVAEPVAVGSDSIDYAYSGNLIETTQQTAPIEMDTKLVPIDVGGILIFVPVYNVSRWEITDLFSGEVDDVVAKSMLNASIGCSKNTENFTFNLFNKNIASGLSVNSIYRLKDDCDNNLEVTLSGVEFTSTSASDLFWTVRYEGTDEKQAWLDYVNMLMSEISNVKETYAQLSDLSDIAQQTQADIKVVLRTASSIIWGDNIKGIKGYLRSVDYSDAEIDIEWGRLFSGTDHPVYGENVLLVDDNDSEVTKPDYWSDFITHDLIVTGRSNDALLLLNQAKVAMIATINGENVSAFDEIIIGLTEIYEKADFEIFDKVNRFFGNLDLRTDIKCNLEADINALRTLIDLPEITDCQ